MMKMGVWAAIALGFCVPSATSAYDRETHGEVAEGSARTSSAFERALRDDLGYRLGRELPITDGVRTLLARRWIGEGAREEDLPPLRAVHHFHNPRAIWSAAGLSLVAGTSSVLWAQEPNQSLGSGFGGQWSWTTARESYLAAVTAAVPAEREAALAKALRAIGHVTHLIQDASVPAHVRNDSHLSIEFGRARVPIDPDSYEDWVEALRKKSRDQFADVLNNARVGDVLNVFQPTGDERALVPIAGLIDTQRLRSAGLVRGVFDPPDVGLAEFVNPNYLSGDTIFKDFALPSRGQLGAPFFELDQGKFRRYWPKVSGSAVEVEHFVAEGALYESLATVMPQPPGVAWVLDDRVAEDYATDLLPRAVGYSAALIDYFFRGKLDVDVVDNAAGGDAAQLRLVGTNASDEPLVNGGLLLFADDVNGTRTRLEPVSGSASDLVVRDIGPGADLASTWFTASEAAERFVAVYQGALGDEPEAPYPGAVIGKVLGGVRVEHVFAEGDNWKIRTPAGVFTLPITTAEYADVRWGRGPDVLVASTWFGEGQPNRFASYAVARRPGSIDLATEPDTGVVSLLGLQSADFPFGAPAGTSIRFDQVIHYRQQLARINRYDRRLRWVGPGGMNYEPDFPFEAEAPVIDVVRSRDFSFSDAFDLLLDTEHNGQFNLFGAERYRWDVMAVTADAAGGIQAIVQILLFAPTKQTQTIEFIGVNTWTGDLEPQTEARIQPFLPVDVGPIWVLLDVASGRVLASTAGAEIALVSEARAEAPPFGSESTVHLAPFEPPLAPGVWIKTFDHYEGGSNAGIVAEGPWGVVPIPGQFTPDRGALTVRGEADSPVGLQRLVVTGVRRADLAGVLPVPTAIDVTATSREQAYVEIGPGVYDGLRIISPKGTVPDPSQMYDVRPWGETVAPRLTFLALDSDVAGGATHVITWDHEAGRADIAADLARGAHGLTGATSSAVLVNSYLDPDFEPAAFVVRLGEPRPPIAFLGESLWSFTLLEPSYLYNAEDTRFYRLSTPLQRTALPAPLAGVADTSGDFHAIRLP